jgi:hypothetical protein
MRAPRSQDALIVPSSGDRGGDADQQQLPALALVREVGVAVGIEGRVLARSRLNPERVRLNRDQERAVYQTPQVDVTARVTPCDGACTERTRPDSAEDAPWRRLRSHALRSRDRVRRSLQAHMATDRSYVEENEAQLRRLRDLVDGLSEEQLAGPMDAGWTVASVLAHMALWDYRIVAQLDRWGPDGGGTPPSYEEEAVDWINDAAKPIFLAMAPRIAAQTALDAAESADRAVAGMSDELLAKNDELGAFINPFRSEHRSEHLDDLERALDRR